MACGIELFDRIVNLNFFLCVFVDKKGTVGETLFFGYDFHSEVKLELMSWWFDSWFSQPKTHWQRCPYENNRRLNVSG